LDLVPTASFHAGSTGIWSIPCDIALPCATQGELDAQSARLLIDNGCKVVAEGANMPTTLEATELFLKNHVFFGPGKAANAGGVATSGLEMSQNSLRLSWTFEEVDAKLREIMSKIYDSAKRTAEAFDDPMNLVLGANIAGFEKVAMAMKAQGIL
jgi:glutamate dehydrogenase (NADP+)